MLDLITCNQRRELKDLFSELSSIRSKTLISMVWSGSAINIDVLFVLYKHVFRILW
jgi:hypothetical protein